MGRTVDDRVVSMAFESSKFQTGVSTTLSAIDKLNASLKTIGKDTNFSEIDKSANKISFFGLTSAIDKIKQKFGRGFPEATDAFTDVEKSSGKVGLLGISSAIDKLKSKFGLGFQEADQAFTGIEKSSGKVTLQGLGRAIDGVKARFGALQVVGASVLQNLTSRATTAGTNLVKSLSFQQLTVGFQEYEQGLNAVQTILSNTKAAGVNLKDVNRTLLELNHYADKTIYNFGQMTKNIGTFTAAGVDLETATTSIKGIANLAALSGSSAEQAATAMYQLSQAISSGRVSLQDWNSVVNAGMGGTVFQRALAQTAVAMGEIDKSAVSLEGKMKNVKIEGQSFRESIMAAPGQQSWLTSDVLTNTLSQLSGDLSEAELKAQGFTDAQVKAIQTQAKMAVDAATKVKTLTQLLDTTKEAVASGWAQTWQIIFGDFGEAKELFTGLSDAIGGFVGKSSDARNSVLQDWKDMGGRTLLIDSIRRVFKALGEVLAPIKGAFRDIFPRKTGKDLLSLTQNFREFTKTLKPSPETIENLRRTFRGFFAILDIGKEIVKGIWEGIKELFKALGDGSGNMLDFSGNIGDLIVAFRDWLKEGDKIVVFFETLGSILALPIRLVGLLAGALGNLFFGSDEADKTAGSLTNMSEALKPASNAAEAASKAWSELIDIMKRIGQILKPVTERIGEAFGGVVDEVKKAFTTGNWDEVFDMIQTGLIAGIFVAIKKGLSGGLVNLSFLKGSVVENLTGSLDTLNGSLKAIQTNIKANTLLQIGAAVALLAGSMLILSKIDPKRLATAMAGVTSGLAALMGAMALMSKIGGLAGIVKMPILAASLILLAGSLTILAAALWMISRLDWGELAKGLTGIGALLVMLSIATKPLSAAGPGMVLAGVGITALAIALNILGGAVKIFGNMRWEEMAQGLIGVAGALVAVAAGTKLMGPSIVLIGPGLVAVGIGLTAIAAATKIFASMNLLDMGKGILGIGLALGVIAIAMHAMPLTLPLTAAGLILVGIALNGIGLAIALMGGMDIGTLAKGIIGMAGALVVLAVGLTAMSGTLAGSASLMVAATALAVLVPLIGIMGKMKWSTIAKGLGAIAIAILGLALVGTVASSGLIALGLAIGVLGAGMLVVSAAVYVLLAGLAKLAGDGSKNIGVAVAAFAAFIAILPKIIIEFAKGLVEIVHQIVKIAPEIVKAGVKITEALIDGLIKIAPKVAQAAVVIIGEFLKALRKLVPDIIKTGATILLAILRGIANNIGKVTRAVIDIVTNFLRTLTRNLPKLVQAGANALVALLRGISQNIQRVTKAALNIVAEFLKGVASKIRKIVEAGGDIIVGIVKGIGNNAKKIVNAGGDAIAKFIKGVANQGAKLVKAGVDAAIKFMNAMAKHLPRLADKGATAIINLMNRMAKVIRERTPELVDAFFNMGTALVQGLIDGITDKLPDIKGKLEDLGNMVKDLPAKAWKLLSPSKVFHEYGENIVLGLVNGLDENASQAAAASGAVAQEVLGAFASKAKKMLPAHKKILNGIGAELGRSFQDALLGQVKETDRVDDAFASMTDFIITKTAESNARIGRYKDQIDVLQEGKENKKQKKKIEKLRKNIEQENNLKKLLAKGGSELRKGLEDEKAALREQIKLYDWYNIQIEEATSNLNTLISDRDNAIQGFVDQYSALPDIIREDAEGEPVDPLKTYVENLRKQVEATKKFKETLEKLRELGLDDETYQKLLEEGIGAQDFAEALAKGGPQAVGEVNALTKQLMDRSVALAADVNKQLYQAGIDAAQGIIDGLEKQKDGVSKVMEDIAKAMVKAIKKKLKIKSPSEEFAEMGKFSMLGMAKGLDKSSKKVTAAVVGVSKDTLETMRERMKLISKLIEDLIDPQLTISVVLDFSDIQNGSKSLRSMMGNVIPISAASSYGQAAAISSEQIAAKLAQEAFERDAMIQFVQNNYSPESLSDVEIYRRTRTQLAQARPVIAMPAQFFSGPTQ